MTQKPPQGDALGECRRAGLRVDRGDIDVLPLPVGTLAQDTHQQSDGATITRGKAANENRRRIPRRKECVDARGRSPAACLSYEMGHPGVPGHETIVHAGRTYIERTICCCLGAIPTTTGLNEKAKDS